MSARGADVSELVAAVLRDGHLYGARPGTASRTLTVAGRRRIRIRLQADIVAALYDPQGLAIHRYYPDLAEAIDLALAERESARPADDDRAGGRNTLTRRASGDRANPHERQVAP